MTGQIIARTKVKDKASLALWLYNGVTSDVYVKDMLGNLTFPKIANSNVVKSSVPEFDVGIYTSGLYRTDDWLRSATPEPGHCVEILSAGKNLDVRKPRLG